MTVVDFATIARGQGPSIIVRRWAATWIDFIILAGLTFGALVAPGAVVPESLYVASVAVAMCVVPIYYLAFEGLWRATPGKFVCGIRVVAPPGGCSWWERIAKRTILRLLEVNPFLLGGLPAGIVALASPKKQRLGDLWAGTFVIEAHELRPRQHAPWKAPRSSGDARQDDA